MRRTMVFGVAAAVALSGCAREVVYVETPAAAETTAAVASTTATTAPAPAPAPAPTTTEARPPATRPTITAATEPPLNGYQPDLYIDMVEEFAPYWYYSYTDDVLLNLAHLSCQTLDEGAAVERLLFDLMSMVDDVDPALNDSIGTWLRAVVRYVCPEHYGLIEDIG